MIVTLSRKELSDCKQAATLRWQLARLSGVVNQRKDKGRTDQDLDFLGIKAELAVSKVFDLDFNPIQLGVDDGADMFLHNISIDVKSTFYPHGKLLFKSKKSFKSNCSVLVAKVDEDRMNVVGFATKTMFLEQAEQNDLGHGKGWMMEQHVLLPLSKLWEVATEQKLYKPKRESNK